MGRRDSGTGVAGRSEIGTGMGTGICSRVHASGVAGEVGLEFGQMKVDGWSMFSSEQDVSMWNDCQRSRCMQISVQNSE